MAILWTKNQQKALQAKGGKYLVAAGAGSGKTAVLTNRIYELVHDPSLGVDFDNLLVLTFTKKAAADMKNKTRNLLLPHENEERTPEQIKEDQRRLPDLETAAITTFDSFALSVVKKFHYELGLPSHVEILDEGLEKLQKQRILDEILEEKYEEAWANPSCPFAHLAKNLAFKDDKELRNLILKVDAAADLSEDRSSFFKKYQAIHFQDKSFFEGCWKQMLESAVISFQKALDVLSSGGTQEESEKDAQFLNDLLALYPQNPDLFWKQVGDLNFPRISKQASEEYKKLHADINGECFKPHHALAASFPSFQEEKECYESTENDVMEVVNLAKRLGEKMEEFSYANACFSFAGIAALARKVVKEHPDVQKKMKEKYSYIMVDEYQDTNDLQEYFLSSIGAENVFQVGDVKQSIYAFRNANPALFEAKRKGYGKGENGGNLIVLADNFRSREPVLNAINDLFLYAMEQDSGGVDYKDGQALLFGNHSYSKETDESHKPIIATFPLQEKMKQPEVEARVIAGDIAKRMAAKTPVQGKGGLRPCSYSDFCILVDKRTDLETYRRVFNDLKIPFQAVEKGESSKKDITLVFRNVLELLLQLNGTLPKKESRLKHLYVSLMRSYLYQEEDEIIFHAVKDDSYLVSPLFQKASSLAERIKGKNLEDVLSLLFEEFAFVEKLPSLSEVKENYSIIERFQKLAASFSRLGWDLLSFYSYFSDIEKYDQEFNIEPASSGLNCVQFMTIHASKGLEFPFVYLGGMDHTFSSRNMSSGERSTATYHPKYGVLLSRIGPEGDKKLSHFLFAKAKREEKANQLNERMRLFYVALTRAKEYLYLVRPPIKERKEGPRKPKEATRFVHFLDAYPNEKTAFKMEEWQPSMKVVQLPAEKFEKGKIELRSIFIPAEEKAPLERASKIPSEPIPSKILQEGTRLHRLLELIDWKSKDVSWIKNAKDRQLIEKAISLPLFMDSSSAKAFQEYFFIDEEEGANGTVDLFLLYEDHIDLVDYKTRNIDDPEYAHQLAVYEAYLSKVFHLPIRKYLLSIKESRLKVID